MHEQNQQSRILTIEHIKTAYLFLTNEMLQGKSSIDQKNVTETLLLYLSYFIYRNSCKKSTLDGFNKLIESSGIQEQCNFNFSSLTQSKIDKFAIENPEIANLGEGNVEEIGYAYDDLQKFELSFDNSTPRITRNSNEKKNKGSFYTPIHIVDYIVEHTVGKYLEKLREKYSNSDSKLLAVLLQVKILDPSVGGGIFLIRAVSYLKHWLQNHLTNAETRTINHIVDRFIDKCLFGNDLNPVACAVSKLSLMLMNLKKQFSNISKNILCLNSIELIDKQSESWKNFNRNHKYKHIGFDIIISNPPFQFGEYNPFRESELKSHYQFCNGQYDVYWLFYELAFKTLLREGGHHGYIIPDALLIRDGAEKIRQTLLQKKIGNIWHVGIAFSQLHVSSVVLTWQNKKVAKDHKINVIDRKMNEWSVAQNYFSKNPGSKFLIYASSRSIQQILSKIQSQEMAVGDVCEICRGEEIGKKILKSDAGDGISVISGHDIFPFEVNKPKLFIAADASVKKLNHFKGKKILLRKTGADVVAAFEGQNRYFLQSVYCLKFKSSKWKQTRQNYLALLGFLNSKLVNFYVYNTFTAYKLIYPQHNQSTILSIPLPSNFLERDLAKLSRLVEKRSKCSPKTCKSIEADIDAIINSAYNLTAEEISIINKHQTRISFER